MLRLGERLKIRFFTLQDKIILIFGGMVVVLIIVTYFASATIFNRGYLELEKREASKNLERVMNFLSLDSERLKTTFFYWANWNESYRFTLTGDQRFVKDNITVNNLRTTEANLVAFVKNDSNILAVKFFDPLSQQERPVSREIKNFLAQSSLLKNSIKGNRYFNGLLKLPGGLAQVAIHQIVKSDGSGPSHGFLFVAKYIDQYQAKKLSEYVGLEVKVELFDSLVLSEDFIRFKKTFREKKQYEQLFFKKETINAYRLINDLEGKPLAIVLVKSSRKIFELGRKNTSYAAYLAVFSVLASLFLVFLFLRRLVFERISNLGRQVKQIGQEGSQRTAISIRGRDEISQLACRVNNMLKALADKEESRRREEELHRQLAEDSMDGIYVIDKHGLFVLVNDSMCKMVGYTREELIGKHILLLYWDQADREIFLAKINKQGRIKDFSLRFKRKDGEPIDCLLTSSVRKNSNQESLGNQGIIRDVTQKRLAEEEVRRLAFHDFLTGLPNRYLFKERFDVAKKQAVRHNHRIAVIYIDLDRFKEVNDIHGHDQGDILLRTIGEKLQSVLREEDTVARIGGDEFSVLLSKIESENDCVAAVAKIKNIFIDLIFGGIPIGASIGWSVYPEHGSDFDSLIKKADSEMFLFKRRKKSKTR